MSWLRNKLRRWLGIVQVAPAKLPSQQIFNSAAEAEYQLALIRLQERVAEQTAKKSPPHGGQNVR